MTLLELLNSNNYRKMGSRYVGPCPKCGGDVGRSFVTKVGSATGHCFACGYNTDTIGYLREFEGMTCKQAHAAAGKECDSTTCQAREKCRGEAPLRTNHAATATVPVTQNSKLKTQNSTVRTPAEAWQEQAQKLVERAHEAILQTPQALDYLAKRGLDRDAVIKNRLGWLAGDPGKNCIYRPRKAWGLPPATYDKGPKQGQPKLHFWIPRGIVIPSFVLGPSGSGDRIDRIRIRRPNGDLQGDKDLKYIAIEGGGNETVSLNPHAPAQMPIESDLDALLVDHVAGDLVGAIPLTTCSVMPNGQAAEACARAIIILVAIDFDTARLNPATGNMERAGEKAWRTKWQPSYAQAIRWPVPDGKDPGEAYKKGVDLRAWVLAGLPVSLHPTAASDSDSNNEIIEAAHVNQLADNADPLLRRMTDPEGREYWITDSRAEYLRLRDAGKVVFSEKELRMVTQAAKLAGEHGRRISQRILDAKHIFAGAFMAGVEDLRIAETL